MERDDLDRRQLYQTAQDTGIEQKLNEVGLKFFALNPRWKGKQQSAYNVVFWLNPCEQDRNNAGYFTVEQLEQWIAGIGPICKKP